MEELLKLDPKFNEAMFITKVNNIFVQLHTAIMFDNLDKIRHFLSSDVERYYEDYLKKLNNQNARQMFDELNVKSTQINDIIIKEDEVLIKVDLTSRYMDYLIDKDSGKFISGVNDHRIEKMNHLTFSKKIGKNYDTIAQKCPGCGANISVNTSGKCAYCGTIFDAENYDWILTSIN